jgi:hypothetical protein
VPEELSAQILLAGRHRLRHRLEASIVDQRMLEILQGRHVDQQGVLVV